MSNDQKEQTLYVSHMTCAACEQKIERGLSKLDGLSKVLASYVKGSVTFLYNPAILDVKRVESELQKLHYPIVAPKKKNSGKQWAISLVVLGIILGGYMILQQTGIFNMFPMADEHTALPMLFMIGILTSVHCIAMCGGINISQCANVKSTGRKHEKFLPSLLYNLGRIVSYTIIGGIVGTIGSVLTPSDSFKGIVAIVASVFMVLMGINLLNLFSFLRKLMPRMPKFLSQKIYAEKVGKGPFVVGLFNGLMPCGPLQAMQLYALSTGSFLMGALSMFLFSAGTVPLMFGLGALSSFLSAKFTNVMTRVSAVLVIILGLMMLNNGLSLSGINPLF